MANILINSTEEIIEVESLLSKSLSNYRQAYSFTETNLKIPSITSIDRSNHNL